MYMYQLGLQEEISVKSESKWNKEIDLKGNMFENITYKVKTMLVWHQHVKGQIRGDLSNLAVLVVCINHKAGNDEEMKKLDW